MLSLSENSQSFDGSSDLCWTQRNGSESRDSDVEECKQCIDYMLDLVSFSINNEDNNRSQHCLPDESDDETTVEVKELVDYMLELVSTVVPLGDNKRPKTTTNVSTDAQLDVDDEIQILDIEKPEEDSFEVIDLTEDKYREICLICGQNRDIKFKVTVNGKSRKCCSWECVATLQNTDCCQMCSTPITDGTQGFRPNFGGGKTSLCSEECLQKYEIVEQPNTQCFSCHKPLHKNGVIFYWQTMEFCSAACVQTRQLIYGSKCAQCQIPVNRQSLGKYSVRFGDIIKQFCVGTCLETYKKSLKVCAFCQKDLKCCSTICIATFGFGEKMRLREFCDQICKSQYGLMLSARSANQVRCSQCVRNVDPKTAIEFIYGNKKHTLCSSVCVSAFKYNNKLKTVFCENCHKYGWTNTNRLTLHILHSSGSTRIFCTKKCMSMYVLKNRKIVACLCCKVKKYNFDLIERYDWTQNNSRLFCSLNCLSLFEVTEKEKIRFSEISNEEKVCSQCQSITRPQFFLRVENKLRSFCTYQCVFQHQRQFLPDSLIAQQQTNGSFVGQNVSNNEINLTSSQSRMWTPSFYGQQKDQNSTSVRTNIVTKGRPPSANMASIQTIPSTITTVNKSISLSTPSVQTETTTQMSPSSSGTQTVLKEIVRETKEVIVKVPVSKVVKNKSTLFRPPSQTKGTSCRPFQLDVGIQTDPELKIICPVLLPIPIFVPVPVSYMQPLAVPLPLPVPFFLKPDPPPPPKPEVPNEPQNGENLNLTDQQFGEIKDLIENNESVDNLDTPSQQSSSKRRNANNSDAQPSKRGRRQSEGTPRGRGRGRGRGGRGGRGRGRGRGRGKKEEWEMSSSEEEEEEVPEDNDSDFEDQQNESSNNSMDFNQSQQLFGTYPQNNLQQIQYHIEGIQYQTPVQQVVTPSSREEPKRGRGRGRKKTEDNMFVDQNSGIESNLSTNTENAGINALRIWLRQSPVYCQTKNILSLHQNYLSEIFCKFVEEVCQVHGQNYTPDYIYLLCLDLQKHLAQNNRLDNIFMDPAYKQFIHAMHTRLSNYSPQLTCIQEEHLWDCGQLGAHSPTVLLNTVMYLSAKYFHMIQIENHTQFSFSNLSKEWGQDTSQCLVYQTTPKRGRRRKTLTLYENQENQLRCPVKLFEFYLSKCPENVTKRSDMFYLYPIEGCVPDSVTWYSTNPLTNASVTKMLQRILVVREIVAINSRL